MSLNSLTGISSDIHSEVSYGKHSTDTQLHSLIEESERLKETICSLEEKIKKEKLINRITDNDRMTKFPLPGFHLQYAMFHLS